MRGRCLSYGEGITYWPVVEMLKQLGTLPRRRCCRGRSARCSARRGAGVRRRDSVGLPQAARAGGRAQPLVCVLDDMHWGRGDVARPGRARRRPLPRRADPAVCMARPELLERRPSWGGGKVNATTVLLEPLDAAETEELLAELGGVSTELADGSCRRPRATRCSSRRCWRSSASPAAARWRCRRRSRRCLPPGSTSSTRPSAPCSSAGRSRGAPSIAAPWQRSTTASRSVDAAARRARAQGARPPGPRPASPGTTPSASAIS